MPLKIPTAFQKKGQKPLIQQAWMDVDCDASFLITASRRHFAGFFLQPEQWRVESKAWRGTARYPGIAGFAPSQYRDFGCVLCWFSHVMNPGHCLVIDSQDWWYSLRNRFRRLMEKKCDNENIFRYGYLWISHDVADTCHISCLHTISSLLIQASKNNGLCLPVKKPLQKHAPRHKISCCVSQRFTPKNKILCFTWQHWEIHRFLFAR